MHQHTGIRLAEEQAILEMHLGLLQVLLVQEQQAQLVVGLEGIGRVGHGLVQQQLSALMVADGLEELGHGQEDIISG